MANISVGVADALPPYVRFETRAVEDRVATEQAGHYVGRDVYYALVTPRGSKDIFVNQVDEWFSRLAQEVQSDRYPAEWLQAYRKAFEAFKAGEEAPLEGTSVKNWAPASPAVVKTLLGLGIRTVEELAQANEETITRLGLGGRSLAQRAKEWLSAANNIGRVSEETAKLKQTLAERDAQISRLTETMEAMRAELKSLTLSQAAPKKG